MEESMGEYASGEDALSKNDRMVMLLGGLFAALAAACFIPAARRRLAELIGPVLERAGSAPRGEVLRAAGKAAASAAVSGGAKRAMGA